MPAFFKGLSAEIFFIRLPGGAIMGFVGENGAGNFPDYLNTTQLPDIMQGLYSTWDNTLYQAYLKRFRLPSGQKIKAFSKGMAMKLAIAAALAHHPLLLILDEATSGLEKAADYIAFIHDGNIILTDVTAFRKRDFQTDVLVADRQIAEKKYKDIVIDHVSIEEIMLLLINRRLRNSYSKL